MATKTVVPDIRSCLDTGNLTDLADIVKLVRLGRVISTVKLVVSGLTSATSFDITTAAFLLKVTSLLGLSVDSGDVLPAIGSVETLRVTAGAATAGPRTITDVGGTPSTTLATISDDGKTLTFEAGVTAFVLTFTPRVAVPTTTSLQLSAP